MSAYQSCTSVVRSWEKIAFKRSLFSLVSAFSLIWKEYRRFSEPAVRRSQDKYLPHMYIFEKHLTSHTLKLFIFENLHNLCQKYPFCKINVKDKFKSERYVETNDLMCLSWVREGNPDRHEPPRFDMQHRASAMQYKFYTKTSKVCYAKRKTLKNQILK